MEDALNRELRGRWWNSLNHTQHTQLTSYLPRLFKKDMLTEPEVFLKIISQNQDNLSGKF